MRDSSYNFHTQTQQKFSRGGEKKVMKKSLSILLSFALVFGLFASMASAADAELTVAQKYQALVDKGVLKGNPDGDARLDANLNRAEFATIAIAISGLAQEKPATATFSDVNSKQWWYGAIEAAAKAGLVEGYNGKFNPKNNVTVEEVIKVAVQAAGLETDEKAEAVEGASAWAAKYIKAALDAGLIATGLDYKADATRGQTILVGYSVYEKLNQVEPAKASVSKAEATNYNEVTVTLNKAVDVEKAKLALKRGASDVKTETKWAEDKKSATLTLTGAKIFAGEYSVTLSGLDAADIDVATASFTGEDETVKALSFVTSSDDIASSTKAKIKVKPENQYGKLASFTASSYNVTAGQLSPALKKDAEGYLVVTLDTKPTTANGLIQGVSPIFITVSYDNNRVTATKTFKLGTPPVATSLELGKVEYSNKGELLSIAGEVATVILNINDQYGNPITPEQDATVHLNAFLTPYTDALNIDTTDTAGDTYKAKVSINATNDVNKKIEKAADYTLTVQAGGASKTATIKVGPAKLAMSVKVGQADRFAAGDVRNAYVSLDVLDGEGNPLTAQQIVDNADRIKVSVSGATSDGKIVRTGKNKGKVLVTAVPNTPNGFVFVSAYIATINTNSYDNKSFKIEPARAPESILLKEVSATKAVLDGQPTFELYVQDQYGDTVAATSAEGIARTKKNFIVEVRVVNNKLGTNSTLDTDVKLVGGAIANAANASGWMQIGNTDDDFAAFNGKYTFETNAADRGTTRFEARLVGTEVGNTANKSTIATTYASVEVIAPDAYLAYSLDGKDTLFATDDAPKAYGIAANNAVENVFKKTVGVVVKDGAGNKVAVGAAHKLLNWVTSSAPGVVEVIGDDVIIGRKAGTATVSASVYGVDGTTRTLTAVKTAKSDPVVVKEIKLDKDEVVYADGQPFTGVTGAILRNITVVDQYGNEYTGDLLASDYAKIVGINFSITDVVSVGNTTGSVQIVPGAPGIVLDHLKINNAVGFSLNVVSADGEVSQTIAVTVQ